MKAVTGVTRAVRHGWVIGQRELGWPCEVEKGREEKGLMTVRLREKGWGREATLKATEKPRYSI